MANVLVTLDKPWSGSKDGRYRLKMGSEPCEHLDNSEYAYASAAAMMGDNPIKPTRVKPGKPIYIYFDSTDPEKASALVPEDTAKLYFGDWDCVEASEDGTPMKRITTDQGRFVVPAAIRGEEKERVANVFGGYMFENERGKKLDQITHVPIGPPNVPHVTIKKVDTLGRPILDWIYRPHEFFKWDEDFPGCKPYGQKNPPKVVFAYA
jgi:hypothetical protein